MKVLLIILAVLAVIITIVLSFSAEFTIVFDNGWSTKLRVLFIEKNIQLSKLLSFIIFPEKAADEKKDDIEQKKEDFEEKKAEFEVKKAEYEEKTPEERKEFLKEEISEKKSAKKEKKPEKNQEKEKKPNYIQKVIANDGIVGLLLLISNILQTASKAATTLIKGLHIYSLYVKMIIGGGDAADIAEKYGSVCGCYYPIKGYVLNSLKVDMYDDYIQPDFIAPSSEYEFQLILSVNVALLLKVLLSAGRVFLKNLIKNK